MYSYEERIKAVQLYIKFDKSATSVINELGYPKNTKSIKNWYEEYIANGDLHQEKTDGRRYTQEQRNAAVTHYLEHGKCLNRTVRAMGYPSRNLLSEWVSEDVPEYKRPCNKGSSSIHLSQSQKEQAVIDLCTRTVSARVVGEKYGVQSQSIYNWKRQLLDGGSTDVMPKKTIRPASENIDELKAEIATLQEQANALNREVYRLRLERDVLEKAAEIIKRPGRQSGNTDESRESHCD